MAGERGGGRFRPAHLVNCRFVAAPALRLRQLDFVHLPPLQKVFGSTDLTPGGWARGVLAGLAIFVVAELEKRVVRRRLRAPTGAGPTRLALDPRR